MGPQSLFNPPPSSSSSSSTTAYKPNATAGPSSESHFKRRAESPTHSQAVTQAQIQGIDISSSEHGISSWSSNLNNNAIKEGKGKEPMRPGFRIITHELIPISNTATPSTTNSLSPGNTYLTGTSSTTTEDQTANQTDFLDSHASDGRTLCVRHQMMADQGVNGKLQKSLDSLPLAERAAVTSLWSTFSSSAHPKRKLILEGLLTMCCFSQLSHLQEALHVLIRVDPFSLFPREVSLRVLGYLDAISLGKAAQVSRQWKSLADDDLLWRRMCGQHIERKCVKCGWGLPLLERRRLRNEIDKGAPASTVGDFVHDGDGKHVPVKVARSFGESSTARSMGGSSEDPMTTSMDQTDHPGFSCSTDDHSNFPQLGTAVPRSAIPAYIASHPTDSNPNLLKRAAPSTFEGQSSTTFTKRVRQGDVDQSSSDGEAMDAGYWQPINKSLEDQKAREESGVKARKKPWKHVYCERLIVERNWRKGRCEIRTLKGHTNGVMCLQFHQNLPTTSPSYPVLITGSYDRTARVWNLETGQCVRVLTGHTRAIRALQFDGMMLITGSMDRTLRIWNWRTGDCVRVLEGHTDGIICLNYDKEVLASGSADSTIKIWNFKTSDCFTLRGHNEWVNSVLLWDGKTAPHDLVSADMNPSQYSGSGDDTKFLFSASDDGSIKLWDLLQRTCIRTMTGHTGQVQSVRLVIVDREADAAEEEPAVTGHITLSGSGGICSSPFNSNFHSATVGIPSSSAPVGSVVGSNYTRASSSPPAPGFDPIAYQSTPNAPVEARSHVHGEELNNGQKRSHMHVDEDKQVLLVSAGLDNLIKVWDVETGKEKRTLFGHIEGVWTVDVDPLRLASGSHDRTIKIWDRESGKCAQTLVGHRGAVTSLQLSDDVLVSGSDDGEVKVWDFGPAVSGKAAAQG